MAGSELNVKLVEEILRLKNLGFGKRKVSRTLKVHRDTVSKYWNQSERTESTLITENLSSKINIESESTTLIAAASTAWTSDVNWQNVRTEVLKGVPINIVFDELVEQNRVPVQYPAFWKQLSKRAPVLESTMVRIFTAGERAEIDYCDGISIMNVATGELIKTELFVGVLCQSRYAFAEFSLSQKSSDFLSSHVRMLEYFGGCPQVVSPDNLKSAVTKAHRYDPIINQAYTRLAAHYGIAIVPARVRTPKDKAIVERTIQIFQRWFFMKMRNRIFTSLLELNQVLQAHLILFNNKIHRVFKQTRRAMFEAERESLMPLPKSPYVVQTYAKAKLSRDCHLIFDFNFYSAPHLLRGLDLDVWASQQSVEIYHEGARVAFHARSLTQGKFKTDNSHYPPEHQAYLEENIVSTKSWAGRIGPATVKIIESLLSGPFPLRHLRRAQSVLSLSRYSDGALENACAIAGRFNQTSSGYIERVIKQNQNPRSKLKPKGDEPITREFNPHVRHKIETYH